MTFTFCKMFYENNCDLFSSHPTATTHYILHKTPLLKQVYSLEIPIISEGLCQRWDLSENPWIAASRIDDDGPWSHEPVFCTHRLVITLDTAGNLMLLQQNQNIMFRLKSIRIWPSFGWCGRSKSENLFEQI